MEILIFAVVIAIVCMVIVLRLNDIAEKKRHEASAQAPYKVEIVADPQPVEIPTPVETPAPIVEEKQIEAPVEKKKRTYRKKPISASKSKGRKTPKK